MREISQRSVKAAADTFVQRTNENIEKRKEESEVKVESVLPQKRGRKEKKLSGRNGSRSASNVRGGQLLF